MTSLLSSTKYNTSATPLVNFTLPPLCQLVSNDFKWPPAAQDVLRDYHFNCRAGGYVVKIDCRC